MMFLVLVGSGAFSLFIYAVQEARGRPGTHHKSLKVPSPVVLRKHRIRRNDVEGVWHGPLPLHGSGDCCHFRKGGAGLGAFACQLADRGAQEAGISRKAAIRSSSTAGRRRFDAFWYIANKFADQGTELLGTTAKDKALVEQWLEVEGQNFHPIIHSVAFQLVFCKWRGLESDPAVLAAQVPKLEAVLDVYEARLASSKYLAGDFFSLADLSHIPYLHYLVNVGQFPAPVASRKHVNAWFQDISSRPAWTKYLALISAP